MREFEQSIPGVKRSRIRRIFWDIVLISIVYVNFWVDHASVLYYPLNLNKCIFIIYVPIYKNVPFQEE
ncbi:MAG: hypothetical protein A3K09_08245 [Nitrospinae bacterium RIFCSPLOWO2_12_FULL_47_7]|nr:MAG: hypothetical protein A3K09_08245 [Nitrospinae bacterium RIFCSPLOWO2_12_FULL_47_7]